MTARSIRRAVELKQKELARKADQRNSPVTPAVPISAARLAANQANAQFSTDPTSETGKAKSSRNAVKPVSPAAPSCSPSRTPPNTNAISSPFATNIHPSVYGNASLSNLSPTLSGASPASSA
jgi:hypothetical protein